MEYSKMGQKRGQHCGVHDNVNIMVAPTALLRLHLLSLTSPCQLLQLIILPSLLILMPFIVFCRTSLSRPSIPLDQVRLPLLRVRYRRLHHGAPTFEQGKTT